jgi:hypothetical protein
MLGAEPARSHNYHCRSNDFLMAEHPRQSLAHNVKQIGLAELRITLRSMPLIYWLMVALGLLLSFLYFGYDCLIRPVCK